MRSFKKRHVFSVIANVAAFIAALTILNVRDYRRLQTALRAGEILGQEGLKRLADWSWAPERGELSTYREKDIPAIFAALRPIEVKNFQGSTGVKLYERGDIFVSLRVDTYADNQLIRLYSSSSGTTKVSLLWNRDPAATFMLNPVNRLVSIYVHKWPRSRREWVIVPDEIRVIDRSPRREIADTVALRAPLSESGRVAIESALREIPAGLRGHRYHADVYDGIELHLNFAANGVAADDSIELSNTWREELAPLLDSISAQLPAEFAIKFQTDVTSREWYDSKRQFVQNLQDYYREPDTIPMPWWCVWRLMIRTPTL